MKKWIENLKNQFSLESLRETKFLTPVILWYESLPPDQKNIANLSLIGGTALLLLVALFVGQNRVGTLREEIQTKQMTLSQLLRYHEEFENQTTLLKQLEKEAVRMGADFSLLATLESLAQGATIGRESIESISPKQLQPGKHFIETEATVQLVRITLKQLTKYFYQIEADKNNLIIKEVRIKPRFDNPQFLNVTFKVSSYKPAGAS